MRAASASTWGVQENITLVSLTQRAHGFSTPARKGGWQKAVSSLNIRTPSLAQQVSISRAGKPKGDVRKVVERAMPGPVLDEPTSGIDAGARAEIMV